MISTNTRIIQVNLNRSLAATESVLQLAIELKIDLILVQEPWIISERLDYSNS
jgi:putative NIF3 family GTP cyclohydrolase 1 type 2